MTTGAFIVVAAVVLALGFGLYRRLTDGKARIETAPEPPRLDAERLGTDLGAEATLVQFSSSTCAPCKQTHRLLTQVVGERDGVRHVELDAETRLDLVNEFNVTRTPTVLLLDATGTVRHRIVGATRRPDVVEALAQVAPASA